MSSERERLAAACLFPSFAGHRAPDWLRRRIDAGLGGIVLFARNVRDRGQLLELTAALRAERDDLLVAIDEEGGDVTRLEVERGSSYPGNRALGVVDDVELTEQVATALGTELADAGVNLDLAPVGDLASDLSSPIVGVRSFGADPGLVARHVAAFVRGLQAAGVAACAKHFPGHGGTALDSHLELPTIRKPAWELMAEDMVPFRAAIDAGVRAIMTAHIRVPALDSAPAATVSRKILTELLRDELGFEGMVITDALEMGAMSATVGVEKSAVAALIAGADALCLGGDFGRDEVDAVARAIAEALHRGSLAEERLREAGERVRATAFWPVAPRRREDRGIGLEAARRALRTEGQVKLARSPLVVELDPEPSIAAGHAGRGLGDALRARLRSTQIVRLSAARALAVPADRQLVVAVRDAHRHAWERETVEGLLAADPDAVVVETGLAVWRPERAAGYVATQGAGRVNLEAAADELVA